jgi:hypothetical protein
MVVTQQGSGGRQVEALGQAEAMRMTKRAMTLSIRPVNIVTTLHATRLQTTIFEREKRSARLPANGEASA